MLFLTHRFCRTAVFLAAYFTTGCQLHAAEARTKLHSIAEEEYETERPLTFLQQLRTELQAERKTLEAAGNTARAREKSDLIQDVIQMLVKIAANSGGLNLDKQEANSEALTTLLDRVAKDRLTDHHQAVCALALAGKKLDAANEYLAQHLETERRARAARQGLTKQQTTHQGLIAHRAELAELIGTMNQASAGRMPISEGFATLLSRLKLEAQHTDLALVIVEAQIKNQEVPTETQDAFNRLDERLRALDKQL